MATGHIDWYPVVIVSGEIAGLFKNMGVDADGRLKVTTGYFDESGVWSTEGELINPVQWAILADTGPLSAGFYRFDIYYMNLIVVADQCVEIQYRNAANSANIKAQLFNSGAYGHFQVFNLPYYEIAANERMRVQVIVSHTAQEQASILAYKYA